MQALNPWLMNFPLSCTWGGRHAKELKSKVEMFCVQHSDTLRTAAIRRFVAALERLG